MFRELIPNIDEDCKNGVYSRILQVHRCVNCEPYLVSHLACFDPGVLELATAWARAATRMLSRSPSRALSALSPALSLLSLLFLSLSACVYMHPLLSVCLYLSAVCLAGDDGSSRLCSNCTRRCACVAQPPCCTMRATHDAAILSKKKDERHFNYYFWKHSNDSDINIRILSPSYLYPHHPIGFTDWVLKENRPIVVHGMTHLNPLLMHSTATLETDSLSELGCFTHRGWFIFTRSMRVRVRARVC